MKFVVFTILILSSVGAFADTTFNVKCESGGDAGHWFDMSEMGVVEAEHDYVKFSSNEKPLGISYYVRSWSRTPFDLISQKFSGGINDNFLSFTYNAKEDDDNDGAAIKSIVIVTGPEKTWGVNFQEAVGTIYTKGPAELPVISMTTVFANGDVLTTKGGVCNMSLPKMPEESEPGEL